MLCFDAAAKSNYMAYSAILTNSSNIFEVIHQEGTNVWHSKNSDIVEGRAIFGELSHFLNSIPQSISGTIQIITNSKNTKKWIEATYTASLAAKPGGEIWLGIQNLQKSYAHIKFEYVWTQGHPKPCSDFNTNPHAYLILKAHNGACTLRAHMEQESTTILLPEIKNGTLYYTNRREYRSINILLKEEDSREHTFQYLQQKFPQLVYLIDIEARSVFAKGLEIHELKCVTGFNHHGSRENIINPIVMEKCDFCGEKETWCHILTCRANCHEHKNFIKNLETQLSKKGHMSEDAVTFLNNIEKFLEGYSGVRGTQSLLGYQNLFRGIVAKDWFGSDDAQSKYTVFNKVIVFHCVKYYAKLW